MALNKVTYTDHQTVITAENLNTIQDEIIANAGSISGIAPEKYGFAYGTCSTAESTTAKTATITGYQLVKNSFVAIRFTYAVPASSTLNINSLGAKAIYWRNAVITANVINAGDTVTFIYDGSYYRVVSIDEDISAQSANGYQKSADGMLICYGQTLSGAMSANTTAKVDVTYPIAFTTAPKTFVSFASAAPSGKTISVTGNSATGCTLCLYSSVALAGDGHALWWMAIGRWK